MKRGVAMAVSVEALNEVERRVSVQIPWEEFDQKQQAELKKLQQKARIDGFRPGKVPLRVVQQHYGRSLRYDVFSELMQASFMKLLEEEKLNIVGRPTLVPQNIDDGKPLEYIATFEVFPEFNLVDLSGQKVVRYTVNITEADIDRSIEALRKNNISWTVSPDAPAENGDKLRINFIGTLNGVPFDRGSADDYDMILGETGMIEGFESGMLGMKAGESRDLQLTFPEKYSEKSLAGQPVCFHVTVTELKKPHLPDLDEKFFKILGITEGGIEALRKETLQNMERERDAAIENRMKHEIFNQFADSNAITVPKALIAIEVENEFERAKKRFEQLGMKNLPANFPRALFEKRAEENAKLIVLIRKAFKEYELKADPEIVNDIVQQHASAYDNPEEMMAFFRGNQQLMEQMEHIARERQLMEKLMSTGNVEEESINYFDLIRTHGDGNTHNHDHAHDHACDHHHDHDCDHDH
jgi:trigger factor